MKCQFCDEDAISASLCGTHFSRWDKCGRPRQWNGDSFKFWIDGPKDIGIQLVMTTDEVLESHAGFMHDFYDYCQANHLDYMPEMRASIRAHHPQFRPKT